VRHGQSTWNADGRWQGQEDPPLSELGERQAVEAAGHLDPPDAVWASDLVRARRTAETLASHHGVEVAVDARLRERHAGPWQGRTRAEIEDEWPGYLATGGRPDGYEGDEALIARVLAVLDDIADAHRGEAVTVVTHGGVVGVVERHLGGTRGDRIPNLGGRRLERAVDGRWRLGDDVVLVGDDTVTVPGQL
jgi:broad specificity phosphatase PhoE